MLKKANSYLENSQYREAIQQYDKVINSKPGKDITIAAYYNKAQAYDGMGQYAASAQSYEQIINIDPHFNDGEIYYEQGQVYQLARMQVQARKAYEKFLKINPKHPQCYFNLGQVLQIIGDQEQAIKCYDKATQFRPNYSKAYLLKIAILKKLKRNQQIFNTCSRALQSEPTDFQILYEQGFSLIGLQRYKQAIESLKQCIRNNKKYVKAYIAIADCYYKTDKDNQALQVLKDCLSANKDVIKLIEKKQVNILMGTIYMNGKRYKEAIDCFREILSQRPVSQNVKTKFAFCLEQYGNYFFSRKQFSDALNCYSEAVKYDSNKNSILNNQGLAYQNINNFEQAQKCFNLVLKRQPKNSSALNNLATLYHLTGKSNQSNAIFQQLAKQNPNSIEFHINSGRNYFTLHKYHEAYDQFQKAFEINPNTNNFNLYNDLAVTLQKLNRYQKALIYANKANQLTKNRSPLILLNRASILMNLQKITQAKKDFQRASQQLRSPDKNSLSQLGINLQNIKYMFNQLNHYSYLMAPINDFKKQIMSQIGKMSQKEQKYSQIVKTVQKAQQYAMSRIIQEIKKDHPPQKPNPQQSRKDYNTIVKFMDQAKQQMIKQMQQINQLQSQVQFLKKDSAEIKNKLKFLPQSMTLRSKLQNLYDDGDIPIWQYGKQLYWILNGYLKGYMLVAAGIVEKGKKINRSTFNKSLKYVTSITQFAKNIPVIGDFADLISKVCGLFLDIEDDAVIEKMYQMISYNYDTQEELNDEICNSVLTILDSPQKIRKIKQKLIFKPTEDLLQQTSETLQEIIQWFSQKKNEFIMHMRGFQKAQSIVQSQLAVIDVGAIISIILDMQAKPHNKNKILLNATKRVCTGNNLQKMIMAAYKRQNQNIRVSNNSFCTVMKLTIQYDNPLLNNSRFMNFTKNKGIQYKNILNLDQNNYEYIKFLLSQEYFEEIIKLLN